ncbi:discoidin domain-containing protein [Nonomuraea sp. N2-4H]|uniref:discoidin domain-containing protein n=1 Tax=Nonomuraea sp. N2-4H TaxID=3128898 RepID=UPI0032539CA2
MPFTWDPATGDVTTAVDGFPINEPFWGGTATAGQDWYELNFGSARTFDEVRLYFKDSRQASGTYRAPASYDVQYHDGSTWVSASSQVKNPATPRGNYNVVRFNAVNAQRMRVVFNAVSGARTGLTEIKVHNRGGGTPQPSNLAQSAVATASYTSPWESVAAVNDGIDPPSSNDTVNPRWGCWPETGQQWVELTWPSAGTLNRAEVYFFDDDQGIDMPGVVEAAVLERQRVRGRAGRVGVHPGQGRLQHRHLHRREHHPPAGAAHRQRDQFRGPLGGQGLRDLRKRGRAQARGRAPAPHPGRTPVPDARPSPGADAGSHARPSLGAGAGSHARPSLGAGAGSQRPPLTHRARPWASPPPRVFSVLHGRIGRFPCRSPADPLPEGERS